MVTSVMHIIMVLEKYRESLPLAAWLAAWLAACTWLGLAVCSLACSLAWLWVAYWF